MFCLTGQANAEALPSAAEMWKMVQAQQKQIDELKAQLNQVNQKTEAVTEAVEAQGSDTVASSTSAGWWNNTQLGGYGELHYHGGDKDRIDFHRFVLMVNHQFSEDLRLYSELELEHALAGEGKPGEVELEQAYVQYDVADQHKLNAGLFLLPVGMLNERHEPATFFGVDRNPIETNIIPTTWWEAGIGATGELPLDLRYDLAFHSGLKTTTTEGNAFKIRNGRQKVAEASAKAGAVTGRLRWNGVPGVDLAISTQYQSDVAQDSLEEDIEGVLLAGHADIRKGPVGLRALYAHWDLSGDAPKAVGRDEQAGWFVEPAYYLESEVGQFGIFARYNQYDNEAGDSGDSEYRQVDLGLNYWPHQNVVLKADVALVDAPDGKADDEILNLGVGFNY